MTTGEAQDTRYWLNREGLGGRGVDTHDRANPPGDLPMTEPIAQTEQTPHVTPEPGSRLEQLHAAYSDAKAAADHADKQLKAITDAIKLELTQAAPEGVSKIALLGPAGPTLRLSYTETWRFDSRRFKAEDPETYVRYAKKSGSWTLRAVPAGESE